MAIGEIVYGVCVLYWGTSDSKINVDVIHSLYKHFVNGKSFFASEYIRN